MKGWLGSFCVVLGLGFCAASASAGPVAGLRGAVASSCAACDLLDIERVELVPGIAQYTFPVRVGPGAFDRIRLHRVVAERAPFVPVRASRGVLLAHGDLVGFNAAFLTSVTAPGVPDEHALPIYLAARGLDVWGIDFGWTLVPAETADLSFFSGWGIERDARDLGTGLAIARAVRTLTGSGAGRLHLLGWSRGGQVGYAYLGTEAQRPPGQRHVRGFLPVDIYLKTDDPSIRAAACVRLALTLAQLESGQTADPSGGLISTLGLLAASAPGDPSPVLPGFTNRQAGLLVGVATFSFQPPGGEITPTYHFTGGTFDENGLPAGLTYSNESALFTALQTAAPYEPLQVLADGDAATCESSPDLAVPDVAIDDHLGDITVPVLYVGAGGGMGELGVYTTTLLGSTDVTTHVVSLVPPEARLLDIGHADIFVATDAPTLFWQTIYDWLRAH
jgi:hypothetical protein